MRKLLLSLFALLIIGPCFGANSDLPSLIQGTTPPQYLYGTPTGSATGLKYNGLRIKNVLDYGAVCDGSTNDQAAIQAAVNDTTTPFSTANRGVIYFPGGICQINSPVTFELSSGILAIGFSGNPGAKIRGNFADALLKRSPNSPSSFIAFIENLELENDNAAGKGIMFHSIVGGSIRNVRVDAFIGIETYNSQSVTIEDSSLSPNGLGGASIGIVAGNATAIRSTDLSGFATGITHSNLGLVIDGGRYESMGTAIKIGVDSAGSTVGSSGVSVSGLSMESNDTAIEIMSMAGGKISGIAITAGDTLNYGIRIHDVQSTTVEGITISGTIVVNKGVSIEGPAKGLKISTINSYATDGVTPSWNVAAGLAHWVIDASTNFPGTTVAALPTAATVGTQAIVIDALAGSCSDAACNWGANVTGGTGSLKRGVSWNGSNWTIFSK